MNKLSIIFLIIIVAVVFVVFTSFNQPKQPYVKVQTLTFEKSGGIYEEKISVSPGIGITLHATLEETGGADVSLSVAGKCLCSFGIYNSSFSWNPSFACDKSIKANTRKTLSASWDGLVYGNKLSEGSYKIYVSCDKEKIEKDLIIRINATNEECKECIVT
jgi:hypothetical protein